eukprot:CAMPEP_0203847432 /NCGR_PEP_ID=MMETSP0359-20131031/5010_1 /ASSEMBLY_ACC=CAM_ASM_000338 /TAXON_ID=268821 /ORGANISM="Scrippsiella Hangoei, Strain SHTV-5" /LENGTH=80 /DNA_ID=CAMNT_0050762887 /DNA_START=28 /DNA_END=268 /DNA_ORIENTATION=-
MTSTKTIAPKRQSAPQELIIAPKVGDTNQVVQSTAYECCPQAEPSSMRLQLSATDPPITRLWPRTLKAAEAHAVFERACS